MSCDELRAALATCAYANRRPDLSVAADSPAWRGSDTVPPQQQATSSPASQQAAPR